ncbi:MAG: phosphatase PAP2 family protein [Polyangiaceae bacterium]
MFEAFDLFVLRALYAAGEASAWLDIVTAVTFLGSGFMLVGLAPAFFRRELRAHSLSLLVTIAVTSGVVASVKAIVGRARPCHSLDWVHPIIAAIPTDPSFPSGHAAGSFAFAAFLFAKSRRIGLALFAMATAVAASRIALGVHYPSDVLAGALLGALLGTSGARVHMRFTVPEVASEVPRSAAVDSAAVDLSDADAETAR